MGSIGALKSAKVGWMANSSMGWAKESVVEIFMARESYRDLGISSVKSMRLIQEIGQVVEK